MEYSRYTRPVSPTKGSLDKLRTGSENNSPGTPSGRARGKSIADRYIDSLAGSSPLKPRSPASVNADYPILSPSIGNSGSGGFSSRSPSPTRHHHHLFDSSNDISQLKSSSQTHFRTLAAETSIDISDGDIHIPGITDSTEDVAGLQGRIRLQRSDTTTSHVASRNWMDKQRKNLQAYEYLCHIGEAKE
ncbi:hypothetical protein AWJ20_3528 [Sugiyamaella lignohabitans]|uniref:Uncharacterized protein n=1 Tax=Sugiyamaella lignohabitans TaxID=796027 RepID=A0A167FYZ2_9ASCO|nr:uncharacterized protein AWJ20_3528 [Sugiyamaella lignohabitans]ANB15884.1 hypothetical protein AWJ20_3528 [Sugiyamaella lignohabitans]